MGLPRHSALISTFAIVASLLAGPSLARPTRALGVPAGSGGMARTFDDRGAPQADVGTAHLHARSEGTRGVQLYPSYVWPMERALHDGLAIGNYVDEDSTAGVRDYENGDWTYDTHRGTDIRLDDFRAMDRGMRIRSAAAGTVSYVVYDNLRDRNCAAPDNPTLNFIEVANGDGTYTYYYHLRANSTTVKVGEAVQAGEVLGMAGSSGYSSGPHLHFEPADYLNGGLYTRRDPWAGPGNPFPGLWQDQAPYSGDQHFTVFDMGVTTQAAAGGDLYNIDYCAYVAERLSQPTVFGIHEPWLPIWFYPQGLTGDAYRVEIRRPDNSLYDWVDYTLPGEIHGGYQYWFWYWEPYVSAADYGTWTAKILVGGLPVRQTSFVVGPTTVFGPRFTPRDGRSFRVNGALQRDTVHVSPLGGPVTYALRNAPASVTLVDSILSIGATSAQATRSMYFQVVATDVAARTDTAWYHVVDPSKPREPVLDAGFAESAPRLTLVPGNPNPFLSTTTFHFSIARAARVRLTIFDLAGRRLRTLLDRQIDAQPRGEDLAWDGRDDTGRPLGGGVYFALLAVGKEQRVARIVRLQ